jgi:hypothetical protein
VHQQPSELRRPRGGERPHTYGNRGDLLVNAIDYTALIKSIHRSLFVLHSLDPMTGKFTNDAEVGWTANNSGYIQPHPYFEWVKNGVDSGIIISGGTVLAAGSTHNFRVADSDGNGVWQGFLDGMSLDDTGDPINVPYGRPITNSERRNTCDWGKAHFTNPERLFLQVALQLAGPSQRPEVRLHGRS